MGLKKLLEINAEVYTIDAEFIDETIKNLNLDKDSKILEIGTGFGTMTTILALNDFNVLTGEPENHHHDWGKAAKALGVENKIKFQYLNAEKLPFPMESFDAIFMHFTLVHIKKRELALNECLRVIKPNGLIVIIEHNEKGIEYFHHTSYMSAVPPYPVDPREFITRDDVSTELITGSYVNFFILRKK